ncbi:hypothetical protein [Glutamicibacter protophormiae]|nr:hypothetical protein [Glutamicibacter protophormiae]QRQ77533.1 hypothetical protein JQN66_11370 [Glutamicibacter protophormiae]WPR63520.1 hypothetical protein SLW72_11560 [Glutamicibacter protophormiae]WPR67015.1 hypothetical protein SLW73_11555 [Glutamicibacter protophormiae]
MYFRRGNNWSLTIYTDPHLLMALYLRELAGVNPAEVGPNCRLEPDVKERTGPHSVHGQIKQEWGSWWDSLTTHDTAPEVAVPVPANLLEWLEDNGYPELARLARPHYGQATLFAHQHTEDFERRSRDYIPDRMDEIEQLLIERGIEHAADAVEKQISVIEVPLKEPRAWLTGGSTILASSVLLRDSKAFRGFIQPMLTIIFPI